MIKISNLEKSFDKRGIAGIRKLDLILNKNEILALMGPNGSGKTSLLKMIAGELDKEGGEISIHGDIGFFQGQMDVENINVQKFLTSSVKKEIDDEKKIQLARDLADTFEFTFQLRQNMHELSSGQKQKILIASVLINRPEIFLMDEPFAHLDPYTRVEILRGLFRYIKEQEMSVIWVTHDLLEAQEFADRIAVMNFGKIEQHDSPLEILKAPRNLFVAKFLGYRNFITQNGNEILVIPDHAWLESSEGEEFEVTSLYPGNQKVHYQLKREERTFYLVQDQRLGVYQIGQKLRLTPNPKLSFRIPL